MPDRNAGDPDSDYYTRYGKEGRVSRIAKKSTANIETKQHQPQPQTSSHYSTRRKAALAAKQAEISKFMENFDPENSIREKRKNTRKVAARRVPGALHDEAGIHIGTEWDLCDCLQRNCKGCHFPCKKCSSQKCGLDCRSNRKFIYEEIEYHGYDFIVKNPTIRK